MPERLACYTPASGGKPKLAGVSQPGFDDSTCAVAPGSLFQKYPTASLYQEWATAPSEVVTQYFTLPAHGKAMTETLTIPIAFTSITLPLTPQGGAGAQPAATTIVVANAGTGAQVASASISSNGQLQGWFEIPVAGGGSAPAGTYNVMLYANDHQGGGAALPPRGHPLRRDKAGLNLQLRNEKQNKLPSIRGSSNLDAGGGSAVGWISNPWPAASGGAGQITYLNSSASINPSMAQTWPLSARLAAVMQWQLNNSLIPGTQQYDILTIRNPRYRGTGDVGVNSGSSYYDLYRMGFAATYINLRYLQSLHDFADMQAAGLIPSSCAGSVLPCVDSSTIQQATQAVAAAIGNRFGIPGTGKFVTWVSCNCTDSAGTYLNCDITKIVNGSSTPGQPAPPLGPGFTGYKQACGDAAGAMASVNIDFLPAQALAAKLGVTPNGDTTTSVASALQAMVTSLRLTPGKYRTNGLGFENPTVGPRLWLAFDRWKYVDSSGFAVREAQQTGDWMIFSPASGGDGNGNFGLQEENGASLLSTNAFVYEAAGYLPASPSSSLGLYQDWKAEVVNLGLIGNQLATHNASVPMLPGNRPFVRVPMTSQLVIDLCEAPRGGAGKSDWWGELECSYYKTVTFDLPENGLAIYSYAKGALGLTVGANGAMYIGGASKVRLMLGVPTVIPVPVGWDTASVASLTINGLNAGATRNVTVKATLQGATVSVTAIASQQ